MPYGILIKNSNNDIQFDSRYAAQLVVVDRGTMAKNGTTGYQLTGVDLSEELFFVGDRGSYPGNGLGANIQMSGTLTSATITNMDSTYSWPYILAKPAYSEARDDTTNNNYGLEVFDGTGTAASDLQWSSRYSEGHNIVDIINSGAILAGLSPNTSYFGRTYTRIFDAPYTGVYVCAGWMYNSLDTTFQGQLQNTLLFSDGLTTDGIWYNTAYRFEFFGTYTNYNGYNDSSIIFLKVV